MIRFGWRAFDALHPRELHDLLRLRQDVFVLEQTCLFADIDGRDPLARHLLAWTKAGAALAGTLRLFGPDARRAEVLIGRVATAAAARGSGLGRALMVEGLAEAGRLHPGVPVRIEAQSRLERFYGSLGFVRAGEDYIEDGIAHCAMMRA